MKRSNTALNRCHAWMGLILLTLMAVANPSRADPAADVMTKLFLDQCVPNEGWHERIRAWAVAHKLSEVTSPAGRSIYVGTGSSGTAWWAWTPDKSTAIVLAIRDSGACAVFAGAADPAAVSRYYDAIFNEFAKIYSVVTPLPDKNESKDLGIRIGKVRMLTSPGKGKTLIFSMITNERPGGAYQATLQMNFLSVKN